LDAIPTKKMPRHITEAILLWVLFARINAYKVKKNQAPIFVDNIEFLSNASNIVGVSLPVLLTALKSPNSTNETPVIGGYDWTKPYAEAVKLSGHKGVQYLPLGNTL
jgi:hypothetical protein